MGEDCGTWTPHLQVGWQSPNLNPLDVGKPDGISAAVNPGFNMVSNNETMPALGSSTLPQLQLGQSNEPSGWFYCLPCFPQGFTPALNFTAEGKPPADHVKRFGDKIATYGESSTPMKQLLVIDQTGGQPTVVYSSRFGSPTECLASWHSKLHGANYWRGDEPSFRGDLNLNLNHMTEPTLAAKVDENHVRSIESEMREDTEEINALLYSDSDGYSTQDDDDEVTSTGHSPSTITTHDMLETFRGVGDKVASSAGKTNKRKLLDGYYDDIQLMDTASSQNLNKSAAAGDDSELRCSSNNNNEQSLSGNKKMKKEKIRDALSILQSIIPGRKDKDLLMLLDDAIHCLKSLKNKAQALGLDAL